MIRTTATSRSLSKLTTPRVYYIHNHGHPPPAKSNFSRRATAPLLPLLPLVRSDLCPRCRSGALAAEHVDSRSQCTLLQLALLVRARTGRQGGSEERLARGGIRYEADKMHLPKETMGDSVVQSSEVSESEASSFASLYLSQPHSLSGSGTGSIFSPSLSLLLSRRTVQRISRAQR